MSKKNKKNSKKNKKKLKIIEIILSFLIILIIFYNQDLIIENSSKYVDLNFDKYNPNNYNKKEVQYNKIENLTKDIKIEFCPSNKCFEILNQSFNNAKFEIKCAFYELDEDNFANLLKEKSKSINVSLIIDNNYLEENSILILENSNAKIYSDIKRGTRYNNYMHHKFCVIDKSILITGSMNPTTNCIYKNNNNIIKIESELLSKNYLNEFDQMQNGIFGENKKSMLEYNNITLIFENQSYIVSSYLCPQDRCAKEIIKLITNSKEEIVFATFTLTNDEIANSLIKKSLEGVSVKGIIEKRNYRLQGSDIYNMTNYFSVLNDTNKYNMHHKFFVIDNKYVITGSMNPTGAGDNYNDENVLIIENENIAKLYREEFMKLFLN